MKKTTTARIEDTLDIVAEKIIDLENTAKQFEQIKRAITNEVSRIENLHVKVDVLPMENTSERFIQHFTKLNNQYLNEIEKKNRVHRPLYYLILFLLITLLGMFVSIVILRDKNKDLQHRIEWYMNQKQEIKTKN